jgi:hypothetical protein
MSTPAGPPRTPAALRELGHQPEPVLKAIRRKCLDCSGGSRAEVADCLVRGCPLFPFRLGKNPWRRPASEAQREASRRNAVALANPVKITESSATDGAVVLEGPPNPPSRTA